MSESMPATQRNAKDKRSIALPRETWEAISMLSEITGATVAEFTRECVHLGLSEVKKRLQNDLAFENAKLVKQKLMQRQEKFITALAVLEKAEGLTEAQAKALQILKESLKD